MGDRLGEESLKDLADRNSLLTRPRHRGVGDDRRGAGKRLVIAGPGCYSEEALVERV